jgi:uncharacterized protein
MKTEEERCAEAKQFRKIDAAFRKGDLDALRAAVGDPAVAPNGGMPDAIGPCLVHSMEYSDSDWLHAASSGRKQPHPC